METVLVHREQEGSAAERRIRFQSVGAPVHIAGAHETRAGFDSGSVHPLASAFDAPQK